MAGAKLTPTATSGGLVAEREPDAVAAAQAVEHAVAQLGHAYAAWTTVESDVAALLRRAGRDTRNVPRFPQTLATLVRDARRAGAVDVPPPLPGGRTYVAIAPHDDPDPDVRDAARTKIKREAA